MSASLKQHHERMRLAGVELVMIMPDSLEQHRAYGQALFGSELPYLYAPDTNRNIARAYSLLRKKEHHHGGFYYRSLRIVDRDGVITHRALPWTANTEVDEYHRLFDWLGMDRGEWAVQCGLTKAETEASRSRYLVGRRGVIDDAHP